MGILASPQPTTPPLDQATVDRVAALMKAHCAPTTWDKAIKSLRVNKFPFKI